MPNYKITTVPSGRSPEHKYFFGEATEELCTKRPNYCKVGNDSDFTTLRNKMDIPKQFFSDRYPHRLRFSSGGYTFLVLTDSDVHAQFVRNMFSVLPYDYTARNDWLIIHSVKVEVPHPHIYVHLDDRVELAAEWELY